MKKTDTAMGTLRYPYTTEPVVLKIVDTPYSPINTKPIKVTWTQETELWISETIRDSARLIDEVAREIANDLYKQRIDRILYQSEQAEVRRLQKINRFMKQVGAWD